MKSKILFIAFAILVLNCSFTSKTGEITPNSNNFELVKSKNNISIYSRWIEVDKTRKVRQLKVDYMINSSISKIISVLQDDKHTTQWMKGSKTFYQLKSVDQNQWFSYVQFAIPWPFDNQDCVIKYEIVRNSDFQTQIKLIGMPDYIKKNNGITRISHFEAVWTLKKISEQKTKVEYTVFSKQPSSFPRWATDPIIQNNLMETMIAFAGESEK